MNKRETKANPSMSRRDLLKGSLGVTAGLAVGLPTLASAEKPELYKVKHGRINQSVVNWCFKPMTVDELAQHAVSLGLKSLELVTPEHFPTIKRHGLVCAITSSHGFTKGFAHKEEHEECLKVLRERIDANAEAGFPSVITFSGFRRGISDEDALNNMVDGLKKIVGYAEKKNVTVCLEMLNSKVNVTMKGHPDYWCDRIEMAAEVCKRIASERMKILFDIYHVQIMEGDIISHIKQFHQYVGHYHTAGNPGRNEIDDTQEINYPPIMKAIVETGYQGFVGQEFIPTRDPVTSLSEAVKICDV